MLRHSNNPWFTATFRRLILSMVLQVCLGVVGSGIPFTYQGRLMDDGRPAQGSYDLRFRVCDAVTLGSQVGKDVLVSAVAVSQGMFTVSLDFGDGIFTGLPRWIEISARPHGAEGPLTVLEPRQPIGAVPYALHAFSGAGDAGALTEGTLPDARISSNIARASEVLVASNILGARLVASETEVQGRIESLVARLHELTALASEMSNQVAALKSSSFRIVGDHHVTVAPNDTLLIVATNYTASRAWMLPPASSVPPWRTLRILDRTGSLGRSGNAGRFVQLSASSGDTINHQTGFSLGSPYCEATLVSDGVSQWVVNVVAANSQVAIGNTASANGAGAVSIGNGPSANGAGAIAIGNFNSAFGSGSVALGSASTASGSSSFAAGPSASASGSGSVVVGAAASSGGSAGNSIVIGPSASTVQSGDVIIGESARRATTRSFGAASIAIGNNATNEDGRIVSLGPQNLVRSVSSTALGRGIYIGTNSAHGVAIGRGAYVPDNQGRYIAGTNGVNAAHIALQWAQQSGLGVPDTAGGTHVWIGSGWRHAYTDFPDGSSIRYNPVPPSFIHAYDALDESANITNNIAGGHLYLLGGAGTGTAVGGSVRVQTSPAGEASNNTKNAPVTAVEWDANAKDGETRMLLFDITAGTLRRVSIGAPDSGGAGFRVLRIPN